MLSFFLACAVSDDSEATGGHAVTVVSYGYECDGSDVAWDDEEPALLTTPLAVHHWMRQDTNGYSIWQYTGDFTSFEVPGELRVACSADQTGGRVDIYE